MDRIAKINAYAEKRDNEMHEKLMQKETHLLQMLNEVKALAPRLRELMEVGKALCANGIPLGPKTDRLDITAEFLSNGWSHRVGFIGRCDFRTGRSTIAGFGIVGGGACGSDLYFNEDGEISDLFPDVGNGPVGTRGNKWKDSDIAHLERFLSEFGAFEKKVYNFVDSL